MLIQDPLIGRVTSEVSLETCAYNWLLHHVDSSARRFLLISAISVLDERTAGALHLQGYHGSR